MMTRVKTAAEIESMRVSGKMLAQVLDYLKGQVKPGLSTKHLADLAKKELQSLGGRPAFLGYQGFPDVLCVSVNDEVVHGIPSQAKIIKDGDIVSLDFGVIYQGMITDAAITLIVGGPAELEETLVTATEAAMYKGIDKIKDGCRVGDISDAIQKHLEKENLGIVRELVGHGVGHNLHEEPNIPNFGSVRTGPILKAGMTIAIEPMATLGSYKVHVAQDGWTVKTNDGSKSAHFEHTVLVTQDGFEILTSLAEKRG